MTIILWLLIIAAFMLAFVGLIKPIIPSVLVLWVGFLIYQFGFHNQHLSWVFYVSMALLTILILCADFLANKYFVNRFGGSKFGEYAALIGVVIGCFVSLGALTSLTSLASFVSEVGASTSLLDTETALATGLVSGAF
ncbi:DUF456 domain-containing protein, partial [Staphylococcus aureus]|uniref:DUF456 domain-containing protein n=1 Tax=Staphylococcus aureus TaxID=1280 RepID=UPI003BF7D41E